LNPSERIRSRLIKAAAVALWVCGLAASAIIGGFIGSLLERPYSSGAGLVWGGIVGIGLFATTCVRLWLAGKLGP
jgi:hypothetical protein